VRLLLIEDSQRLQRTIGVGMRKAGYAIDVAKDGAEGFWLAKTNEYDVIILDLMLPRIDGLSVLKQLRASGSQTHVLILTARDTVEDRVLGLRTGADDYLVKPFSFDELVARVQALTRRGYGKKNPQVKIGGLVIDMAAKIVIRDGKTIELAAREFALLEQLLARRGEVVSRSDIEAHIYDAQVEPMSNVVDAAVYALRKKIDEPGQPSLIETRRGMGYAFRDKGEQ